MFYNSEAALTLDGMLAVPYPLLANLTQQACDCSW